MFKKVFLYINILFCVSALGTSVSNERRYQEALVKNRYHLDSALHMFEQNYAIANGQRDTVYMIKNKIQIGKLYTKISKYSEAVQHYFEASYLAEQAKEKRLSADALMRLAEVYQIFKSPKSLILHRKANKLLHSSQTEDEDKTQLITSYYSLAQTQQCFELYPEALISIDSCIALAEHVHSGPINKGLHHIERARILVALDRSNEALKILQDEEQKLADIKESQKKANNTIALYTFLYAYMGEALEHLKHYDESIIYYQKSLNTIDKEQRFQSHKVRLTERLASIYAQQGNYPQAYAALENAKSLSESFFGITSNLNQGLINLNNSYMNQIAERDKIVNSQKLAIAEKEKAALRQKNLNTSLLLSALLLGTLFIIYIIRNRARLKQKKADDLIENRNRELTVHSLKLIEMEELIAQSIAYIKRGEASKEQRSILSSLKQHSGNNWDEFNQRFTSVHNHFYADLKSKHPKLTPNDLRLCALIKLNFSSKEMASLLGISPASTDIARHRLRHKLGLGRAVKLNVYIDNI